MEKFLKIFRENNIPRDGFYYPKAYNVVNEKLQQYSVSGRSELLIDFLDFIRVEMHVDIQWKNKYMIDMYEMKKSINCH